MIPIIENTVTDRGWCALIRSHYGIMEEPFEHFVEIDKDVNVFSILLNDDTIDSIRSTADIVDDDDEQSEPVPHVSMKQASAAFTLLKTFTEQSILYSK